jgi:hypothetical protein
MTHRSPWGDPNVEIALQSRHPTDIALIRCPRCGNWGYYNEGSHFSCSVPDCEYSCGGAELDGLIDAGEVMYLADFESQDDMEMP